MVRFDKRKRSYKAKTGKKRKVTRRKSRGSLYNVRYGGLLGLEKKYIDYTQADGKIAWELTATGINPRPCKALNVAAACLNSVGQGDGASDRDGNKITCKSLHIKGNICRVPEATGSHDPKVRIIVAIDTQNNNTPMVTNDLANITTASILGFRNIEHIQRYKVLWDKVFTVKQAANYDATNAIIPCVYFKKNLKLNNLITSFSGSANDAGNITDNAIKMFVVTDLPNGDDSVQMTFASRMRFYG